MLIYSIESNVVKIEEQGSKRLLYLATLRNVAKESDREALNFLIKIHLRNTMGSADTLSFNQIVVSASQAEEAKRLLAKTGRLFSPGKKEKEAEKPWEVFPELRLSDATGCFANLWMNYGEKIAFEDFAPTVSGKGRLKEAEKGWEKDLLEAGFIRKQVGNTHYYCPSERVKQTLMFLLEVGWQVVDFRQRRVLKQTGVKMEVKEEGDAIAIRGHVEFQGEKGALRKAMQSRLWVEINETTIGLLDRVEKIEGTWEEETLRLKKQQVAGLTAILDAPNVEWEESVRKAAEGLRDGARVETALPGSQFRGELLPYQQKGVDWLWFLYRWGFSGLLADEMGLGKTVQVLAFFSRLRTNLPILIVAPTSLLYNWRSEIRRFLGVEVYVHSGADRCDDLSEKPWILTSYAILRLDEELFAKMEFEVIALDESNAIKTATTQTARAAYRLKGRFRIAMSGTPIENRAEELMAQFRFLLPDLSLDVESLRRKVRPFLLRRRKEEVQIDLPEKIEQIVWVEMDEAQAQAYEAYRMGLKTGLLKKVEQEGLEAHRMEVLEAILRLRQICCDPRLVGLEVGGAKLVQLMQDVEEAVAEKRKVLIYSQFTTQLQLIRKELRSKGWDPLYLDGSTPAEERGEIVKTFQEDPERSLFLLSLKAGGVGLNLTAADTVILFDPWWNEAVERQAIDRAHRIGQKKTVIAKRYLMPHTIEEKILQLKAQKQSTSEQILEGSDQGWATTDLYQLIL